MTRNFCILGGSLKHTMSPPIHERLFSLSEKQGVYSITEVPAEELAEKIHELNKLNGYNVTIPHKVSVIPFLDELDETAKRYGAVNCVFNTGSKLIGYNTDVDGFLRSLEAGGGKLGGDVLLLGSGGVGRMMAIEAVRGGSRLTIAVLENVIPEAEKVVEDIKKLCPDADVKITTLDKIHGNFDLMINSTPVGMYPKTDACVVSDEIIKNVKFIFEAIYNPVETLLMKKAKTFGIPTIGGMAMLVWQAVSAHEIWDNVKYKDSDISTLIFNMEDIVRRDFL